MRIRVRRAEMKDILWVASHLRPEDRQEVETATGCSPDVALPASVPNCDEAYAAYLMDQPAENPCVLFGVSKDPRQQAGIVWMVCTPDIYKAPLAIIKAAKDFIALWGGQYGRLHNVADSRNQLHLKWLKAMGFTLGPYYNINGVPFQHFWR